MVRPAPYIRKLVRAGRRRPLPPEPHLGPRECPDDHSIQPPAHRRSPCRTSARGTKAVTGARNRTRKPRLDGWFRRRTAGIAPRRAKPSKLLSCQKLTTLPITRPWPLMVLLAPAPAAVPMAPVTKLRAP